jgi:hypothetical protein
MNWITWIEKIGAVAGLALIISSMFFFILKWVLEQFKVELIANRAERIKYLETLHAIRTEIDDHNTRSKEFCASVAAEHKEMILTLGRINGFRKE